MSTTSTGSPALTITDGRQLSRAGRLLIGSFIGFVVFVATMIATTNGYDAALSAAAEQRGVSLNDLPAEAVAPINHEYNQIWQGVLLLVLVMLTLGIYIAGVRLATYGVLGRASVFAGAVMPLCWLAVFALDYALGTDNPDGWFGAYDAVYNRAITLSTVAGSLALLGMLVLLRRAGVARRTGVVVAALAVLTVVTAVAFGAPPVVPLLLAAIVGIVMVRTARSVTAG
ncbi:hypothetical protein E1218_08000 [Kribbella turkmenica]|uniref:DUF4386 family protein n=1 Tax=Kribbella turkmenica TaxID=2530375 RepID=A0A4R4XC01_9ACTN|nr:hypothetical protein [Kribbella turkmenica]TDD28198.1 hypothetical protein E1218_08000 [Kribbella turkmenica]